MSERKASYHLSFEVGFFILYPFWVLPLLPIPKAKSQASIFGKITNSIRITWNTTRQRMRRAREALVQVARWTLPRNMLMESFLLHKSKHQFWVFFDTIFLCPCLCKLYIISNTVITYLMINNKKSKIKTLFGSRDKECCFFLSGNCYRIGSEADGNSAFGTRQGIKRAPWLDREWLFGHCCMIHTNSETATSKTVYLG